jgi:hypothetical protein
VSSSATVDLWDAIARDAIAESSLWGDALKPPGERLEDPVFSPLADERFALGLETIYEGYLVHYGEPRLFAPPDDDVALLLGDYLYAHGLVHVAGDVEVVGDLAELISLCSQLRAENAEGDGALWAATAACLGASRLDGARAALRLRGDASLLDAAARAVRGDDAIERALAAHAGRVR